MRPAAASFRPLLRGLALAVLSAALLSACGQLPRPFQPAGKAVDLKALAARQTLHVLPPHGLGPRGEDLAVALAAALEAQGLRARLRGGPGNRTLVVDGRLVPAGGAAERGTPEEDAPEVETAEVEEAAELTLVARVAEPDGTPVTRVSHAARVPLADWRRGESSLLADLADTTAAALAERLKPAPIEQVALPGFPGARLVVLPISGAPGDGPDSLPAALRAELERRDLPQAREPGPGDLLIAGRVEVVPDGPGRERATISWRLLESRENGELGPEIGRVAQANRIPAGQLDGRWGQIARQVADYAADGLSELIGQAGQTQD